MMPRNSDGPKMGSQNYFFVREALNAELSHADKHRLPYEATHGDWASRPFPWPGRVEHKRRPRREVGPNAPGHSLQSPWLT